MRDRVDRQPHEGGEHMRFVTSFAAVLVCATIGLNAQDATVKTKTKVEGDNTKMVTYTGCVNAGTETRTFVLDKVVPVTTTRTTEVAGTGGSISTTSTSYFLVPGEKVTLQQYVGKKVEVQGMLISGDSKTKTEIKREDAPDTKITTKVENDKPRFQVISVKDLGQPCMP
jgi:hypothetical protein